MSMGKMERIPAEVGSAMMGGMERKGSLPVAMARPFALWWWRCGGFGQDVVVYEGGIERGKMVSLMRFSHDWGIEAP